MHTIFYCIGSKIELAVTFIQFKKSRTSKKMWLSGYRSRIN